ncbi:M20/M25/M40 family metallo-hydrolase [Penaeicola halotolerans]|uniref:M20/M25/M40 family metallo-hydrolase n=1 Tax=Penaeicola halotolerans TaxID=2793196 RepID=UPI001CF8D666|nr:M20/M25/M40 family metallo-hydrolase [Penaeicola halotolerans]
MRKNLILQVLIFSLLSISAWAQQGSIDGDQLVKDLHYLASDELKGRKPGTEGNKMAQDYIAQRFEKLGLLTQYQGYKQYFNFENRRAKMDSCVNIVGFIPGESEEVIVITAHYDHLGERDGQIYNGADDNASGTAALMAFAEYFKDKKPKHTLVFAALDAEEMGLQGARALIADFPVAFDRVVLNLNMDMVSRSEKEELYAVGTYHFPELKPHIDKVAATVSKINLKTGHDEPGTGSNDWSYSSDHGPFFAEGVPFIYFGVEDHPDYHKPTDTVDKIKPAFFISAAEAILACIIEFDQHYKKKVTP